ncbi:hypothetical protein [Micromonospora sp. NPDC049374]|uniref:hypothetical protein n=1 Tax=Micromonospora sp. NPDC049374 TaxID=3154352 RepID=UPI00341B25A2
MATPADLYAAILADPDDLDLRRRYADAIETVDPEHAELIRLDLDGGSTPRRLLLGRRVGPRLARPVAHLVDAWRLRRGFVESVTMRADALLDHGVEVWRAAPIRHLVLTDVAGHAADIADSPLLGSLVGLDLGGNPIGDAGVRHLAGSGRLGRLRWLGLSRCDVGAEGAEALAASRNLPRLRYVQFDRNRVEILPYGIGQDIDGRPIGVEVPALGQRLIDRYGPLPWLDVRWAWEGPPRYHDV